MHASATVENSLVTCLELCSKHAHNTVTDIQDPMSDQTKYVCVDTNKAHAQILACTMCARLCASVTALIANCREVSWRGDNTEPALQEFDTGRRGLELGLNSGAKKRGNYDEVTKKYIYRHS